LNFVVKTYGKNSEQRNYLYMTTSNVDFHFVSYVQGITTATVRMYWSWRNGATYCTIM